MDICLSNVSSKFGVYILRTFRDMVKNVKKVYFQNASSNTMLDKTCWDIKSLLMRNHACRAYQQHDDSITKHFGRPLCKGKCNPLPLPPSNVEELGQHISMMAISANNIEVRGAGMIFK